MMDQREKMQSYLEQRFANQCFVTPSDVESVLMEFVAEAGKEFCLKEIAAGKSKDEVNEALKVFATTMRGWCNETLGRWVRRMDEPLAPSHELN